MGQILACDQVVTLKKPQLWKIPVSLGIKNKNKIKLHIFTVLSYPLS